MHFGKNLLKIRRKIRYIVSFYLANILILTCSNLKQGCSLNNNNLFALSVHKQTISLWHNYILKIIVLNKMNSPAAQTKQWI